MRHLKRRSALPALIAVLAATGLLLAMPAGSATNSGVVNGSFQNCSLQGWTTNAATGATAGVTDGGFDNNCEGFVNTLDSVAFTYSSIAHNPFWATAGTKISVYAYFDDDCEDETAYVRLDGSSANVGSSIGCNTWGLFQWTAWYTGYHYFDARVQNDDTGEDVVLYVDVLKASGLAKVG